MVNKSQRIKITENDKNVKVKLEQEINSIDILSLNLQTTELYQSFNANYGVLVGRVIANNNIGVPNAKISIFIPVEEEDKTNSEILAHYPYESPRDKNENGKRYNLLPRIGKKNKNNIIKPRQPFGSFPIKEELFVDDILLGVYKKYYKYTALTNEYGDYMIFGAPVGLHTVHMSVDITDIGAYSMTPASMVTNLGYSENLFTSNRTKIKSSNDLDDLPHIETQDVSTNIVPFWGNTENFEIGITRQDFRIRARIEGTFSIFGNVFTDGEESIWGQDDSDFNLININELYHLSGSGNEGRSYHASIASKRPAKIIPKIYAYPPEITDEMIDNDKNDLTTSELQEQMIVLTENDFSFYQEGSSFAIIVNCNRSKLIGDEFGNLLKVDDDYSGGIFSELRGFLTIETDDAETPIANGFYIQNIDVIGQRAKIKIPQKAEKGESFGSRFGRANYIDRDNIYTNKWRKQEFKFQYDKIYGVSKFLGTVMNNGGVGNDNNYRDDTGFLGLDSVNQIIQSDNSIYLHRTVGSIVTNSNFEHDGEVFDFNNDLFGLEPNVIGNNNIKMFGANWLNFSIYLPQIGILQETKNRISGLRGNTSIAYLPLTDYWDNEVLIAGTETNTFMYARSDLHYTDFVEINRSDLNRILTSNYNEQYGFKISKDQLENEGFVSDYKYGNADDCPPSLNGGKVNAQPSNPYDNNVYFFKGLAPYDCVKFINNIGII
ncbi:MAG: hypothetical protein ACOCVF_00620 [bacterium]